MPKKTVICKRPYSISAETLWQFLRDFYDDWHPAMAWCVQDPNNIRRFAGSDDGTIYREQLVELDDAQRRYQYVALEGIDGIDAYRGTLQVVGDAQTCTVTQSAEIHAPQPRLDSVVSGTEFIFNMGLDALETLVAERANEFAPDSLRRQYS